MLRAQIVIGMSILIKRITILLVVSSGAVDWSTQLDRIYILQTQIYYNIH